MHLSLLSGATRSLGARKNVNLWEKGNFPGVYHLKYMRKPTGEDNLKGIYPAWDFSSRTLRAFPSPLQLCGVVAKQE